jgi:hypothetical protein
MRRSLTLVPRVAAAAAAAVLLTACGGGDGGDDAASSSSAASSSEAPESSESSEAPEADSEFCQEAADIPERVGSSFTEASDPAALTESLQNAAGEIRAIEPPDEIAEDWTNLADGLDQAATALDGVDLNDPEAAAQVQADLQELQGQLQTSGTNVEAYLRDQCGIDTQSVPTESGSTAPSS